VFIVPADLRVPEDLHHHPWINASRQYQGRGRMPEVVQSSTTESRRIGVPARHHVRTRNRT
jgi:hypothetical protein